jgi:hypothetical protein
MDPHIHFDLSLLSRPPEAPNANTVPAGMRRNAENAGFIPKDASP